MVTIYHRIQFIDWNARQMVLAQGFLVTLHCLSRSNFKVEAAQKTYIIAVWLRHETNYVLYRIWGQ